MYTHALITLPLEVKHLCSTTPTQRHLVYTEYVLYDIKLVPRLPDLFNVAISDLFQCIIVCNNEELHGNRAWELDII